MSWFQPGFGAPFGQNVSDQQRRSTQENLRKHVKNRSALGDLTNQGSQKAGNNNVVDKEASRPGKNQQENVNVKITGQGKSAQQRQRRPLEEFNATAQPGVFDANNGAHSNVPLLAQPFMPTLAKPYKNIDTDTNDILACADLADEIMSNMFLAERRKLPDSRYMDRVQPDVTAQMRAILVDWLIEVAQEYKMTSETLYQTVRHIDRFLSVVPVQRSQLQLVGVTCMFIASKYEEIYAPQVNEFSFITEETYSKEQIIICERKILEALKFELTTPTLRTFLRRFVKAAAASAPEGTTNLARLAALCSYIAELTLLEYDSLQFLPSTIAASTVLLAQFCLSGTGWNATLQHYTTYRASELRGCVQFLHNIYKRARVNELPAAREKYSHVRHNCISNLDPPTVLPASLFL